MLYERLKNYNDLYTTKLYKRNLPINSSFKPNMYDKIID